MTLQQLEYAMALQHYRSFSRAAHAMGISQPAMSVQVRKLEEELDLAIFDRSKKKIEATDKGRLFLDRARLLLNEAGQLKDLANMLNENVSGTLKIGVIPTLAPYILPLFINELNEKFSQLNIHIREALTEEIIQEIKAGTLDGGIISTPISLTTTFEIIPLFYEAFKLFVSREHELYQKEEVGVDDIPPSDIWLLKEGNCFRDQVNNICEIGKKKPGKELFYFESNSIESLCRIVEFRGGITFLPELATIHLQSEKEDMIRNLAGEKRVREISLLYLPNHVRKAHLVEFSKIIRKNVPRNLLQKGEAVAIPTNVRV